VLIQDILTFRPIFAMVGEYMRLNFRINRGLALSSLVQLILNIKQSKSCTDDYDERMAASLLS